MSLGKMITPLSSLRTLGAPMFFASRLIDTSVWLTYLGFVTIHWAWLTISSTRLSALSREGWCRGRHRLNDLLCSIHWLAVRRHASSGCCFWFPCFQPHCSWLGSDVVAVILDLYKQGLRSVDSHMMKVFEILDVVVEVCVQCSYEDVIEMIHQQWRMRIKTWEAIV